MGFSFSNFHQAVSSNACGMTLDWQKLVDGTQLCQWLWGRPVSPEISNLPDTELLQLAADVLQAARSQGLQPVEPQTVGLNLPNETAIFDSCPFQSVECSGKHIVASGAGIISI